MPRVNQLRTSSYAKTRPTCSGSGSSAFHGGTAPAAPVGCMPIAVAPGRPTHQARSSHFSSVGPRRHTKGSTLDGSTPSALASTSPNDRRPIQVLRTLAPSGRTRGTRRCVLHTPPRARARTRRPPDPRRHRYRAPRAEPGCAGRSRGRSRRRARPTQVAGSCEPTRRRTPRRCPERPATASRARTRVGSVARHPAAHQGPRDRCREIRSGDSPAELPPLADPPEPAALRRVEHQVSGDRKTDHCQQDEENHPPVED